MLKTHQTALALLATFIVTASTGSAFAAEPPKMVPRLEAGPPAIVGGFAQAKDNAPELRAARNMAVAELIKRKGANSAPNVIREEVQVVAGLNFRFLIRAAQGPTYEVIVYRQLNGSMNVTKFEQRR